MVADKDLQFLKSKITKKEILQLLMKFTKSALRQQGFWDASTNTPTLTNGVGIQGYYYVVSVGGTVDFGDGNITFTVGDWVYYDTSNKWVKFETGVAYTPEDIANKATDFSTVNNTLYPSVEAVNEQLNLKQDQDNLLDEISTLAGNGIIVRVNANSAATRTITAGSSRLTVTNGNGTSGNPTIDIAPASIIIESTTARTLALTDAYKYIRTTNAAATAITIPPNADVAFEIGTQIDFSQQGTGVLSFVAGSGVTINTVSLTMSAQYQAASIVKVDNNEWDLIIG